MSLPLYNSPHDSDHAKAKLTSHSHSGLHFGRFFDQWNSEFDELANKESSKSRFLEQYEGQVGNKAEIDGYSLQLAKLVESLEGTWFVAKIQSTSPLITGIGNPHPVENGFLWHHTLGTPYIPGSAIKGTLRSWLESYLGYGAKDSDDQQADFQALRRYFGSAKKDDDDTQAGDFVFFDAVPLDTPTLKVEVMTPHMGDYYAKGTNKTDAGKPDTTPADWHSPVPIKFLTVSEGNFLFSFAPRSNLTAAMRKAALADQLQLVDALKKALQHMGIGAKTNTGFGRMQDNSRSELARCLRERLARTKPGLSENEAMLTELSQMIDELNNNETSSAVQRLAKKLNQIHKLATAEEWSTDDRQKLLQYAEQCKDGKPKVASATKKIFRDITP